MFVREFRCFQKSILRCFLRKKLKMIISPKVWASLLLFSIVNNPPSLSAHCSVDSVLKFYIKIISICLFKFLHQDNFKFLCKDNRYQSLLCWQCAKNCMKMILKIMIIIKTHVLQFCKKNKTAIHFVHYMYLTSLRIWFIDAQFLLCWQCQVYWKTIRGLPHHYNFKASKR